jgi:broad specificity phosphatase PhoE
MSANLIRLIVLCLLCFSTIADEACARIASIEGPRILLIRHGEKDAKSKYGEVHLNQRGEIRAAALAELFFPNVSDSFCTETNLTLPLINSVVAQAATGRHPSRRKIETAEPIASAGSVPLELFDHEDIEGLVNHLREEIRSNRTTLVVWDHSTISDLANDLLKIDRGTIRWPMDRYDVIWQIDPVLGTLQQYCQHLLFGDLWCPLNPIQVFPITDAFRDSLRQRYSPILA